MEDRIDAFDMTIGGDKSRYIHAEPAGNGGTNLVAVEFRSFYFARLNHFLSKALQVGFIAQLEPQRTRTPRWPLASTIRLISASTSAGTL